MLQKKEAYKVVWGGKKTRNLYPTTSERNEETEKKERQGVGETLIWSIFYCGFYPLQNYNRKTEKPKN